MWFLYCTSVLSLFHPGKQLSVNFNASNDNVPAAQPFDKGFLHVSQVYNTVLPMTTYSSAKEPQRLSIPTDPTYNQNYSHQLHHQFKPDLFAENFNYNGKRDNAHSTVLAYSYNKHYDDKFENFEFSSSHLDASASNYVDDEQKDVGQSKHRKRERSENYDTFMGAENENDPIRMT